MMNEIIKNVKGITKTIFQGFLALFICLSGLMVLLEIFYWGFLKPLFWINGVAEFTGYDLYFSVPCISVIFLTGCYFLGSCFYSEG